MIWLSAILAISHQAPFTITRQLKPASMNESVDGVNRTALVYPPTIPSAHPPVVFAFHGHTGTSEYAARSYQLQSEWPEAVVVYPQGLPTPAPIVDLEGKYSGWAIETGEKNKDIRFFDVLFKDVMAKYHADPHRVFGMGHSNGAVFMYTLWGARPQIFAGFASAEGAGSRLYKLKSAKPIFVTIGALDQVIPPSLQQGSFANVLKVNRAKAKGKPFGGKATLYDGDAPTVLWAYNGDHTFPHDSVPYMVKFFKSLHN